MAVLCEMPIMQYSVRSARLSVRGRVSEGVGEKVDKHLYVLNAVRCPYVCSYVRNGGRGQLGSE